MTSQIASLATPSETRRAQLARALVDLIEANDRSVTKMQQVADQFGYHVRTVYNYRNRLVAGGMTSAALGPRKRGPKKGYSRYSPAVESVIDHVIRTKGLNLQKLPLSELLEETWDECRARDVPREEWPGIKGLTARMKKISLQKRTLAREGKKAADPLTGRGGEFPEATRPNQVWLIDHTLADIILLCAITRQILGRPTFTAIIDAYTRMCVGLHISFGRPSRVQTAAALLHAVMEKGEWLTSRDIRFEWLIYGLPDILHADNASEFHSPAFVRGCVANGIEPTHRLPGEPRYGALIERYIGTMMGKVHLLPGTTFSNAQRRGEYDSAKTAVMTLDEFEAHMALEAIKYHGAQHSGLGGFTPNSMWKAAVAKGFRPRPVPTNGARELFLSFLPYESRKLRPDGIHIFNERYWADWFCDDIADARGEVEVRYDPRDISAIYVEDLAGFWQPVFLARPQAPFSLRQHHEAGETRKQQARLTREDETRHEIRLAQKAIVQGATKATVAARRKNAAADAGFRDSAAVLRDSRTEPPQVRLISTEAEPVVPPDDVEVW